MSYGRKLTRHEKEPRRRSGIGWEHEAVQTGRTVYPSQVGLPDGNVLKSGYYNSKIGSAVVKGKKKGFPIFTLTLEERKTCPRSCLHWRDCYGNNMPFAKRHEFGPDLEDSIDRELNDLSEKYPNGFLVRLHVLGDFYSVRYVKRWEMWLEKHPALHVFGFTARVDAETDGVAREVARMVGRYKLRFAIRFSNAALSRWATQSIAVPWHAAPGNIVCPEQLGKTQTCGTCGLCWSTNRNIAFLAH